MMPQTPIQNLSLGLAYPLAAADEKRLWSKASELLPNGRHEILPLRPEEPLPPQCQVYFAEDTPPKALGEHPALRWIQTCSAGADAFRSLPNVRRGDVILTSASGIHSVHIAEFVLAAMINLSRRMDVLWSLMKARNWPEPRGHLAGPALRGRTVAILGYGSIGREIGRMTHMMGMKVVAVTTRSQPHPDTGFHVAPGIGDPEGELPSAWYSSKDLSLAVRNADFLVISCPLTDGTRGIVNASVFDAMKPGACLVNVGRGAVIDFDALRVALAQGQIAGAALDVHPTEPLPADDPVYDLPNAQITPHMSGVMIEDSRLLCDVYLENLTRFVKAEPLLNRVTASLG